MNLFFRFLFLFVMLVGAIPLQALDSPSLDKTGIFYVENLQDQKCYHFNLYQIYTNSLMHETMGAQLARQCSIVYYLYLPPEIDTFFHSVPIDIVPTSTVTKEQFAKAGLASAENFSADYDDFTPKTITLSLEYLSKLQSDWISHKYETPLLLEMLLGAFLQQHLPQGYQNPDIKKYFEEAKSLPYYKEKNPSWISSTMSEKIAVTYFFIAAASSYLLGNHWFEPSSCFVLKEQQPEFFHYLENLFGPQSGFLKQSYEYHGFYFNTARIAYWEWFQSHKEEVFQECRQQVTYIEQAGLPKDITDFFKTVPLSLKSSDEMIDTARAFYSTSSKSISLEVFSFYTNQELKKEDPDACLAKTPDPILLHELLHAFHDQRLLQGYNNPDIIQFYQDANAKNHHYYKCPDRSDPHFTDEWRNNELEFFACTATTFLTHNQSQEPRKVEDIFIEQPFYYNYLESLFFKKDPLFVPIFSDANALY